MGRVDFGRGRKWHGSPPLLGASGWQLFLLTQGRRRRRKSRPPESCNYLATGTAPTTARAPFDVTNSRSPVLGLENVSADHLPPAFASLGLTRCSHSSALILSGSFALPPGVAAR